MKRKTNAPRNYELAGIIIALVTMTLVVLMAGFEFSPFVDAISFILVLGVSAGYALGPKDGETIISRFIDGAVHAGYIGDS